MSEDRHVLLERAANPRRAGQSDTPAIAQLYASAFVGDPVMDWVAKPGPAREAGLLGIFEWLLAVRAIPFGEVWMAEDCSVAAAWLPPGAPASPGGIIDQIKLLPMFLRMCGLARMTRGSAMGAAMEKHHPHDRHFYLAFIAVAPRLQGMGLGGAMLEANLKGVDAAGMPAYLENSNPKNTRLYERAGFVARQSISPPAAPPLIAMWRDERHGSSSLSQ